MCLAFSSLTSWAESYPPFSAMMEGSCLERMDFKTITRALRTDSKSHLRAFAKLVMALASLPGVTLDSSSTALSRKDSTEVTVSDLVPGHQQLGAAAAVQSPGLLDRGGEDAQGVVKTSLSLADDLLGGSTQDHGASLAERNSRKLQQGLVTDLNLQSFFKNN